MGRAVRWRFCTKRTRIERVRQRRSVILRDAGITERTQCRYFVGLRRILPILESSKSLGDMDGKIAEWIQDCWERGDVLHQISDALCGLHHYEPWTRKQLPESWKVFAVWRKLESPNRAPPLTATVINAWLMYCIQHCDLEFGALIALGFYALLRTGEMLQVRPCDLLLGPDNGVVSLSDTKTGLRNAAKETVSFDHPLALEILRVACEVKTKQGFRNVPIWTRSAQSFRNVFAHHIKRFDLVQHGFRPYSLRRGGATRLFQISGSMETALLKGRWASAKVAKIYLADGLSFLPGLKYTRKARDMLFQWSPDQTLK